MTTLVPIITLIAGAVIGYLAAKLSQAGGQKPLIVLETELAHARGERDRAQGELTALRERAAHLEMECGKERALRIHTERRLELQAQEFEKSRASLEDRFQNLANEILGEHSKALQERSEKGLQGLLAPMKERLEELQRKVGETYDREARERVGLQKELEQMIALNRQMSEDANNLTRALKGDSKARGDWGEFVLEKVLEASGLREGQEFTRQGQGLGLTDDDGGRQRPDVIVNLPESKHLIIDSKVPLLAYERYVNAETEEARAAALKEFLAAVYAHVDGLVGKHYAAQEKLRTPNIVFMFLPTDGVFAALSQADTTVFTYAWAKGVAIIGPSTLLSTLRTVGSVWKAERQNKNALKIAEEGGRLYDRVAAFVKDLEDLGAKLKAAQVCYDSAFTKLSDPSRGVLRKIEDLRDLGAKTKKKLDGKYLEAEPPALPEPERPEGAL